MAPCFFSTDLISGYFLFQFYHWIINWIWRRVWIENVQSRCLNQTAQLIGYMFFPLNSLQQQSWIGKWRPGHPYTQIPSTGAQLNCITPEKQLFYLYFVRKINDRANGQKMLQTGFKLVSITWMLCHDSEQQ